MHTSQHVLRTRGGFVCVAVGLLAACGANINEGAVAIQEAGGGAKTAVDSGVPRPSVSLEKLTNSRDAHIIDSIGGGNPSIDIEKSTNGHDADTPPGPALFVSDSVVWRYEITNTGDVPLTDIWVFDDQGASVVCPDSELDPGSAMTCIAGGLASRGQYRNVGTASAVAPSSVVVMDEDPSHYAGRTAAIRVEKLTNGYDADLPPGPTLCVGSTVTWTYVVTNIGDTSLAQIVVTDDLGAEVTCPRTDLPAGASMECTADDYVLEGQYGNIGTVTAVVPNGATVTDEDPSHYVGGYCDFDCDDDGDVDLLDFAEFQRAMTGP